MSFFADNFKARFTLPNDVYRDVRRGLQPFFMTETMHGLHVGDVVEVEPEVQKEHNAFLREKNPHAMTESEFLLITSVKRMENGVSVHGFVRLNNVPEPVVHIIDAINNENKLLRKAVNRAGENADVVAMGAL